jgi:hypothetical protein
LIINTLQCNYFIMIMYISINVVLPANNIVYIYSRARARARARAEQEQEQEQYYASRLRE